VQQHPSLVIVASEEAYRTNKIYLWSIYYMLIVPTYIILYGIRSGSSGKVRGTLTSAHVGV
jgi:hypothetical protein